MKSHKKKPFDIIHCDIWGRYKYSSLYGAHYFLTIVDDYMRFTWIFLMKHKVEAQPLIKRFSSYVSTKFESHIKKIRSDNGGEFLSLQSFFKDNGQHSYVYTPQQNGVVERKHRHILQVARALEIQAQLPTQFCGECGLTAVHIINRLPSPILSFKTPFERLYSKPLSHSHLRVFGCLDSATNVLVSHKFGHRAITCIFIGYLVGQKAYKLFNLSTRKIFTNRDIHFHKNHFPYASSKFVLPPSNLGYSFGPIPTPIHDLAASSFVAPNSDTPTFVAPFSSPTISNRPSLHDEQPNQQPTPDPLKTYTRRPKDAPSRPLAIPTPTSSLPSSPSLLPSSSNPSDPSPALPSLTQPIPSKPLRHSSRSHNPPTKL